MQPAFYALRPLFYKPKQMSLNEGLNWVVQIVFDGIIFYRYGGKGLFYLLGGSILGMGLHPISGHFISEHYVFDSSGQETTR
jgi:sphingolipid delta-4 desaturase